jgi:hypothetical protein
VAHPSRLAQEGEHLRMTAVNGVDSSRISLAMTTKNFKFAVLDKSTA